MTTQFATAGYQEVIDLHTEADKVSVIGIHTPIGDTPRKLFKGFFDQFKKFKYLGCSLTMVPAARLPADPLSVSYEAGEPTIDPRDLMNPLMFHGCHGNDLGVILNKLYLNGSSLSGIHSDSTNLMFTEDGPVPALQPNDLENLYYKALTDNTWRKAGAQSGFKKSGLSPKVYSLATTHQISNVGLNTGLSPMGQGAFGFDEYDNIDMLGEPDGVNLTGTVGEYHFAQNTSRAGLQFLTPRLVSLGWMDCRSVLTVPTQSDSISNIGNAPNIQALINARPDFVQSAEVDTELPLVYMGVIMLPPAYKTEQYFRLIITHRFAWKGFRGISFRNDIVETPSYFNLNEEISTDGPDDPGDNPGGGDDVPDNPGDNPPVDGVPVFTLSDKIDGLTFDYTMQNGVHMTEAYKTLTYNGSDYYVMNNEPTSFANNVEWGCFITDSTHTYVAMLYNYLAGSSRHWVWRSGTSAADATHAWFQYNTEQIRNTFAFADYLSSTLPALDIFDDLCGVVPLDIEVEV